MFVIPTKDGNNVHKTFWKSVIFAVILGDIRCTEITHSSMELNVIKLIFPPFHLSSLPTCILVICNNDIISKIIL